jgi:hypothetical protein
VKKAEKQELCKRLYELLIYDKNLPLDIPSIEIKNACIKSSNELGLKYQDVRIIQKSLNEWLFENYKYCLIAVKNKLYKVIEAGDDKVLWRYTDDKFGEPKELKANDNELTEALKKISNSEMMALQRAHYAGMFKDFFGFKNIGIPPVSFGRSYFKGASATVKFTSCELEIGNIQSELDGFICNEDKIIFIEAKNNHNNKLVALYKQVFVPLMRLKSIFRNKEVCMLFVNYNKREKVYYLTQITYGSDNINSFKVVKKHAYKIAD